ncbi:hypothetical protein [Carboxydothermus pertinax]|uniref:DUF2383 domain-containing protein n=1 Tax=Carboxydothermus pertinax TaxID=870242 RepID=A0A1L8CRI5_9THEO|nr:hypothetical protein [Carboxydothermus pertinax]GAV21528.1 hypothetical protein cpu_00380 [Carboxydothermus pertinax]
MTDREIVFRLLRYEQANLKNYQNYLAYSKDKDLAAFIAQTIPQIENNIKSLNNLSRKFCSG